MPRDPKVISLRSIAADVAVEFLVSRNADLCRELSEHMITQSEVYIKKTGLTASSSKAKNIFLDWSDWLNKALSQPTIPEKAPPKDPIEARFYQKKLEKAQRSLTPISANVLTPEEIDAIVDTEEAKALRAERENKAQFTSHICTLATSLSEQMIEDGKTLGVSELQFQPLIVSKFGYRGVLVQSFTVNRNGDKFKCDFRANHRAVTISHPDIMVTADGNRLIRSNRSHPDHIKGAHEFYVKGVQYKEGMVFMRYLCVNGADQQDLANYYQIINGEVVEVDQARWKEVENLLAAGRDPSESLLPKS